MAIDPMTFNRRQFMSAAASAVLVAADARAGGGLAAGAPRAGGRLPGGESPAPTIVSRFVSSCREGVDQFSVVAFGPQGDIAHKTMLPARGHDIAHRPNASECVVFARRPGTFAVAFDPTGARPAQTFTTGPDRHFFGHGVFSTDGRLLYATENDISGERGMISVRDATGGYAQIAEFPSGGIGPHDLALLSDGATLVVANGGIDTNPESGRAPLNLDTMQPSLVYIDVRTGEIIEQQLLDAALHQLSIRHLAVAARDVVTFGCQNEGAGLPALVGWHKRGAAPALFEAPDETYGLMKNYVGSVAVDAAGGIVSATSPRGGHVMFFDVDSRRLIGQAAIKDVCGVAPAHAGEGFLLTTGQGEVTTRNPQNPGAPPASHFTPGLAFDNHAVVV